MPCRPILVGISVTRVRFRFSDAETSISPAPAEGAVFRQQSEANNIWHGPRFRVYLSPLSAPHGSGNTTKE